MSARAVAEATLEVRPYRLRLARPLRTAAASYEAREGFVVLAREGDLVGRGEAAPLPAFGTETLEECAEELRHASFARLPKTPAARHAVELALLDLRACREGVPLAKLLDTRAAREVQVGALLSAQTMPELAREALRAAAEGFATLKVKVGLEDDFARVAVVRDAVGAAPAVRIDANGAWSRDEALRKLHELAPLGIELCEQPTRDLRDLRPEAKVLVAADEMVRGDPEGALERADIVVLKPMVLGGLLPALRLGRKAQARGLKVIVTSSLDGAIARAGAAHLAAALLAGGAQPAAGLATGRLLAEDLCPDTLAPRRGFIHLTDAPGLGL